ncbi:hypothetical protein KOW79_013344 [Hemibagrus wyckioides]|uniref:Uncharacterized protein n=1 Tax=Hemibagrus wyckioides TaxID=337641 RepID=A0A9D3NMM0_9TELE|nr:hypothetical protein KOW79_013344 [Hemibagrus wyckioides]
MDCFVQVLGSDHHGDGSVPPDSSPGGARLHVAIQSRARKYDGGKKMLLQKASLHYRRQSFCKFPAPENGACARVPANLGQC